MATMNPPVRFTDGSGLLSAGTGPGGQWLIDKDGLVFRAAVWRNEETPVEVLLTDLSLSSLMSKCHKYAAAHASYPDNIPLNWHFHWTYGMSFVFHESVGA